MASEISTNYHTAFDILCRNIRRVLDNHVGDDTRIDGQLAEVDQFFRDVAENRHLLAERDWENLLEFHSGMLRDLCQARSESASPAAAASESAGEWQPREMHRGLRIPELVELIVSHLDPATDPTPLAALARTSRVFHHPALDSLWNRQSCTSNLIQCFPQDLWELQTSRYLSRVFTFRRPIAAPDWDRVLHYSRRIRSFDLPPLYLEDSSQIFDLLLQTEIPGKHLLPNLQSLSTGNPYNPRPVPSAHVAILLGPRISAIRVGTGHASLFPMLTERFPPLKAVNVGRKQYVLAPEDADPADEQCISALLRGLQSVECVEAAYVDLPALLHLGMLASLTTLKLHCLPAGSLSSLPDQRLFRHLLHVELCIPPTRTDSVSIFLRSWTCTPLISFIINLPANPTAVLVEGIFSTLAKHCSTTSLQTITLSRDLGAEMAAGEILPDVALKSLTCFVNLVELSVDSTFGYQLDDAGMLELARSWPHIEVLHLQALWHDQTPLMTITSLRVLAAHCPSLRSLELTFDASSVPPPPRELHHHTVTTLNVAHSPISNALDAARYLSAMFPNLSDIQSDKEDWDDEEVHSAETVQDQREIHWSRLWMRVKAYLPLMNDVRAEEFESGFHDQSIEM
ncbi:hypothetical protein FB45DRAFT_1030531 [Roridomyces roridus]|uniref:F-box domain-containing protein n=1 Tax=Roridomyces roridus TaxID=1738132 RepID=A0AAD7BLA8_9AGAR|nr:hypothetical protein FB45DRAFT_1030531 [Roridomyces roridus]